MALPDGNGWKYDRVTSPFSVDGILEEILQDGFFGRGSLNQLGYADIYEADGRLHYELELPGLAKDEITVRTKDEGLVITGEVEQKTTEDEVNYISRGRRYGKFRRTLPLPETVDEIEDLSAKFENGVLKIIAGLSKPLNETETVEVEIE